MNGILRAFVLLSALFLSIGSAEAKWTIIVHSKVPQLSIWDRGGPDWQHWSYWMATVDDRKCWSVTGGKYYRSTIGGTGIVYGGNYVNQLGPVDIVTDTQSAEFDCMATDKKMRLNIEYRKSGNAHTIPPHIYHFTVTGGGVFSKYRYKLNGKEYAASYWDSADLCTVITVHGPDKPDDVETKSGDCK